MSNKLNYRVYVVNRQDNKLYHHCHWPVGMEQAFDMVSALSKSEGTISMGFGDQYWQDALHQDGIIKSNTNLSSVIKTGVIGPLCINEAVALYNKRFDRGMNDEISAGEPSKAK